MDWLDKWFTDATETPAGSILLFLLVFMTRIALDQWSRKREAKKARKKRPA